MKVENHDTTRLGNQHENLLKREIKTINVNYAQINWYRARTRSVYQHIHEIKSALNITVITSLLSMRI
jgi:hypothetical protein